LIIAVTGIIPARRERRGYIKTLPPRILILPKHTFLFYFAELDKVALIVYIYIYCSSIAEQSNSQCSVTEERYGWHVRSIANKIKEFDHENTE